MIRRISIEDNSYRGGRRGVIFRDIDTGEVFDVFPTDMLDLLGGIVIEKPMRVSSRGRIKCLKLDKEEN